ncbi:MAG TPA: hypothetical protein VMY36_04515 [Patescibacteria group bacterium]|nr:hypothetical protein [Patescibacteria group bacterium]
MKEGEIPEPPEVIKNIAAGGEPGMALAQGDRLLFYTAGEGDDSRVVVNEGEIIPGGDVFSVAAASEKGAKKFVAEMEKVGGKRITSGADSPEVARSSFGWSRDLDDKYRDIFGHEDPKI